MSDTPIKPHKSGPALSMLEGPHGGILHFDKARKALRCTSNPSAEDFLIFCLCSSGGPHSLLRDADGGLPYEVNIQPQSNSAFAIERNGLFASAQPSGDIVFVKGVINAWERFRAVPAQDVFRWRDRYVVPGFPRYNQAPGVARIIHQAYINGDLPEIFQENVRKIQSLTEGYNYRLWTDSDIKDMIYENFGNSVLNLYFRISKEYGAARADLFRYLCIYKFGGVYIDIKSGFSRRIQDILHAGDQFLLSQWDNGPAGKRPGFGLHPILEHISGGEYEQWHVIAAAGHRYLEAVIDTVLRNIATYDPRRHGVGRYGVLRLTGPIAYTLAIREIEDPARHRKIVAELDGLLYSAVPDYRKAFKTHYSTLDSPIVLL